ncbi:MAG: hypothetical protein V7704_23540 [Aurantimonas endophytica]|uniref:hypothetical protein n=1 Tax=Aurantimonas endophytica TaxID=1522175 RepID=UPI003001057D
MQHPLGGADDCSAVAQEPEVWAEDASAQMAQLCTCPGGLSAAAPEVAAGGAGSTWRRCALRRHVRAFLSGSATFSNLKFALFQVAVAGRTGTADIVLAAQMLGSTRET